MMHHAIDNGGGHNRISEVIAKLLESNVSREDGRTLAVTAVDDLKEQRGILTVLLFQPIKP